MLEWLDIRTAPKDGTEILLWVPGFKTRRLRVGYWIDSATIEYGVQKRRTQRWSVSDALSLMHDIDLEPTHWAPIPVGPAGEDIVLD